MRFVTADNQAGMLLGDDRVVFLSDAIGRKDTMNDFIGSYSDEDIERLYAIERGEIEVPSAELSAVKLLAPIPSTLHDIICVGVNYADHLEETRVKFYNGKFDTPVKTVYFSKRGAAVIGPGDPIPSHSDLDIALDYEVELAVVIGRRISSDTAYEDVMKGVFGYTIFNDISARTLQSDHIQWYMGKSLDGFSSMGPYIRYIGDYDTDELDVECRVNGEVRQKSNTRMLRMSVQNLLYDLSRGITLLPGDIISTGTPSGVGLGFTPPKWLKKGDRVECEIETLGILSNYVD